MITNIFLLRIFPFLAWLPVSSVVLRGDVIAGITGALVLVPKAMAYAQLSGLPVYFGLYVALVPAVLGALWGSSRQLSTDPVAIVSLMTAAAITPFAVPFSDEFVGLALLLALMVGVIQLSLGLFKLGTIVNFVSHPVILGFMNAAAIIIALSQLDMLLGIPKGRSDFFLMDIWEMLTYLPQTHLPTLAMSVFALALMIILKKVHILSRLSVLIAVVLTIIVSALFGYENKTQGAPAHIVDPTTRALVSQYDETDQRIHALNAEITLLSNKSRQAQKQGAARAMAELDYSIRLKKLDLASLEDENKERMYVIRKLRFERHETEAHAALYASDRLPENTTSNGTEWRIKKIVAGSIEFLLK